jgi:hypothetical protein
MKTKWFVIVAILVLCGLGGNGAWADTAYYSDSAFIYPGYGVLGVTYSGADVGPAIFGQATAGSGNVFGGQFESNSPSGRGVFGNAKAITGLTYGGYFYNISTSGIGVFGWSAASSGVNYGGLFQNSSTAGYGVYGYASSPTGYNYGGYFRTDSPDGKALLGWASATSGPATGGFFQSASATGGIGIWGYVSSETGLNYGVYGQTRSPNGYGIYSQGNMRVDGTLTVTGAKSAVVPIKNGKKVALYAVESSENWFEDFGDSKLKGGKTQVTIDPTFAETVNTGMRYHVFLTPRADCKGLYVTNETGTSFEVRELNGGNSDIEFSYRIVAKRKGFEGQRLAEVKDDTPVAVKVEHPQPEASLEMASHEK